MAEPYHNEEVLAVITQRASADGDNFRARVYKKKYASAMSESVALFDDVRLEHLSSIETWLPRLLGAGTYNLRVYHANELAKPVGKDLLIQVAGPERDVNMESLERVMSAPNYTGPKTLSYPTRDTQQQGLQIPAPLGSQVTAPLSNVLGGVPVGSGAQVVQQPGGGTSYDPRTEQHLTKERELLAREHRMDLERFQAANELKLEKLAMQLQQQQMQAPQRGTNVAEVISAIATAFAPILTAVVSGQQRAQETNMQILTQIAQRPAMDPTMEKFITHQLFDRKDDAPMAKIMSQMAESMSSIFEVQREAVKSTLELAGQGEEPTSIKVVRELVKAVGAAAQAVSASKASLPIPQRNRPRALPGGKAVAPQPPTPVVGPQAAEPSAPLVPPEPPTPTVTVVDRLEAMIRMKVNPSDVTDILVAAIKGKDEALQGELAAVADADEPLVAVFQARLADWLTADSDNLAYIQTELFPNLQARLASEFGEPEDEADDGEEDEAETGLAAGA